MSSELKLETVAKDTPLRLEVAAGLAFPDGSMSVSALRRLVVAQKLGHEIVAGKYYTTLADIEEMRKSCRVPAKVRTLEKKSDPEGPPCGSSVTETKTLARDAMNLIALELKKHSPNTSSKSTTRPKR
jgi:hypothetical protein